MYYNEDTILDVRLNYLNKFVDYFIIVESTFNHRGQKKELNFDIKKFSQFKNKIRYYILDDQPKDIEEVDINDSEDEKNSKYILNGYRRDHFQRNHIIEGIKDAQENDIIIISDIDEIPKLENINFEKLKNKLIFFKQKMCYYKFNLFHKNYDWFGSRACIKKMLLSPQWLRDIKTKSYPFWRLDLLFSKKKYSNIKMVNDGGWHFSYLNTPELIEQKLKSYTHHREYDLNPIGIENLKKRIENRESVYNLNLDQKKNQFSEGVSLDFLEMNELPEYIAENKIKYKNWLD
jgi:beta-1,4-mannosyl-glycoprotein beta-1,4-N-acetylglucosaminyltransferase|tara:strand:+ start:5791 stop:6660 length:870 start_codon:yes stop_codon:yes gene_type:complete